MSHFPSCFRGRSVLVTGHTGFKGTWLCAWLQHLGAEVTGVSLPEPVSSPCLFDQVSGALQLADHRLDLRDRSAFGEVFAQTDPDFVFHLAAQPLVRRSYGDPLDTWSANVLGTGNVLETVRSTPDRRRAIICVTTDKCYLNREWDYAYREDDPLGGYDPYSASKAACEILISSYRQSYGMNGSPIGLASVRAGNVIGGGDWAEDRLVPDCIRSLAMGEAIEVRNRHATRPWQHVLDPLSGYLELAAQIDFAQEQGDSEKLRKICSAFNFGPDLSSNRSVAELVELIANREGESWVDATPENAPHEAGKLNLSIEKAWHTLQWSPTWDFETAIGRTLDCYSDLKSSESPEACLERLLHDIECFEAPILSP